MKRVTHILVKLLQRTAALSGGTAKNNPVRAVFDEFNLLCCSRDPQRNRQSVHPDEPVKSRTWGGGQNLVRLSHPSSLSSRHDRENFQRRECHNFLRAIRVPGPISIRACSRLHQEV